MHRAHAMLIGAAAALTTCTTALATEATRPAESSREGWTISGGFRARYEAIDRQFRPLPAPQSDQLLSLRTNLAAEYQRGPVRLRGELIDSRGYFQDSRSSAGTAEVNALELVQAYVAADLGRSRVTAGRFTMDEGSRRLVARNQFRNTTNAFTGVRVDGRAGDDAWRLFWAMPQYRRPDSPSSILDDVVQMDRESTDLQFFGGSYSRTRSGRVMHAYAYGLLERDSLRLPTRNRELLTAGVRLLRQPRAGAFDYDLEAVYQTGQARASTRAADLTDLDVSAHFLHVELGRALKAAWSPRIAAQLDWGSGDKGRSGRYGRFDTLFGSRRGELGPTSLWGAVQRSNLVSPAVRLEVAPDQRWDAFVSTRGLWLDSRSDSFASTGLRDASGRSGRFAGVQAETRVRYWLMPRSVRLEAGVVWLFESGVLDDAPNARSNGDARYGYADVTVTF